MAYKKGAFGNFKVFVVQGRNGFWTHRAYRLDAHGNYKTARPPVKLNKKFVAIVGATSAMDAISAISTADQSTSTGETNEQAPTGDTHVQR